MNDVRSWRARKLKGLDITGVQHNCRGIGQVWCPASKRHRIPGQHRGLRVQIQLLVCPKKALEKPASYEARSTCDEQPLSPQRLPELLGAQQNIVEILA